MLTSDSWYGAAESDKYLSAGWSIGRFRCRSSFEEVGSCLRLLSGGDSGYTVIMLDLSISAALEGLMSCPSPWQAGVEVLLSLLAISDF